MRSLLADVEPGKTYVYLDGLVIPADASGISADGWYAHHELDFLPQTAALEDRSVIDDLLASKKYWLTNRLPDEGEG
jgi:hypothetical protein